MTFEEYRMELWTKTFLQILSEGVPTDRSREAADKAVMCFDEQFNAKKEAE